ncbi:2690_t:CDS:2, partial [Racocetra fulgida]
KLDGPEVLQLIEAANELELANIIEYLLSRANFEKIVLSKLNSTEVLRLLVRTIELNFSLNLQYRSDMKIVLEKLNINDVLHIMKTDNRIGIRKFFDNMLSSMDSSYPSLRNLNSEKILQLLVAANDFQYRKTVNNLLTNIETILGNLNEKEIFRLLMMAKEWRKEDYDILEKTIHDCIPLIRWYQMSILDISENLDFLKNIISIEPILHYLHGNTTASNRTTILPPRYKLPNHMFHVRPQHFDIIASWIDKKDLKNSTNNNEQITPNES